jgi:replicative DNA helicase
MELTNNPECQVLGALLLDPDYIFQIQEVLSEDDFASSRHRKIFKAILAVGENCDVFTVANQLGDIDENIIYLSDMTDSCPTSKNVLAYAQVVLESGRQRKLRAISQMILESQQFKEKSEVILDKLGEALSLISTNVLGNTQKTLNEALKEVVEQVQERMDGKNEVYRTGFDELDEYMPFEGGNLYLLGGLSGMGKTTLLQSFIEAQIFNEIPCYFNSAEMPAAQVAKRFLQSAGSIKSNFFKEPAKHISSDIGSRMTAGLIKLKDKNLMIDDEQGLNVSQLKVRIRNWISSQRSYQEDGKGFAMVDYAQLLEFDHNNSSASLGDNAKQLRALGKELNIPIILLVQLNEDYKGRACKRPVRSDIAGSSVMYKDADGVIFCYRDEEFNPDTLDKGIMEIICSKNRDGAQGAVRASAEMQYFRVNDIKNKY